MSFFNKILDNYPNEEDVYIKAKLHLNFIVVISLFSLLYTVISYVIDFRHGIFVMLLQAVVCLFLIYLMRMGLSLNKVGNILVTTGNFTIGILIFYSGGLNSAIFPWLASVMLTAFILLERKYLVFWIAINSIVILFYIIEKQILKISFIDYDHSWDTLFYGIVQGGLIIIITILALIFENSKNQARRKVEIQNEIILKQKKEIMVINDTLTNAYSDICDKNKLITDSINYARRIQQAVLPTESEIRQNFSNAFVFNSPKDIISGDFYWIATKDNKKFIAVADCTGHGVPGALLTMTGTGLLHQIVFENQISDPGELLKELHFALLRAFKNSKKDQYVDGMDIAVCVVEDNTLKYAGARRPLIYVNKEGLHRIKGNRISIGDGHDQEKVFFDTHTLEFRSDTWYYLFTDGYQDQLGGEDGNSKFMTANFNKLLIDLYGKPYDIQKTELAWVYYSWKNKNNQTDDVLVVGFSA